MNEIRRAGRIFGHPNSPYGVRGEE